MRSDMKYFVKHKTRNVQHSQMLWEQVVHLHYQIQLIPAAAVPSPLQLLRSAQLLISTTPFPLLIEINESIQKCLVCIRPLFLYTLAAHLFNYITTFPQLIPLQLPLCHLAGS